MNTELVTVPLDDFYPGFDPKIQPNIDDYYINNDIDQFEADKYYAEYDRWSKARGYWYRHSILPRLYRKAYEMPVKAKEWADQIVATGEERNLALVGPVGVGKTFAACATGAYLATVWEDHRRPIGGAPTLKFALTSDFLSKAKNFNGDAEEREVYYSDITRCLVLVLDDAFRSNYSDFDTEALTRLYDARINAGLVTIHTANSGISEESDHDITNALISRMIGNTTTVVIVGPDRRRQ